MRKLSDVYKELYERLPHYLFLFPFVAGLTWFFTLAVMLIYWVVLGRPTYPGQSNPYVAFISDIAAFHLKAFFIIGCTLTSISFIGTVISVHYAHESSRFYGLPGDHSKWRRLVSTITLLAGLTAGVSLFLLALFDTSRAHSRHRILLLNTFGGLGVSALGTGAVWSDIWIGRGGKRRERVGGTKGSRMLRRWCSINFVLMLAIATLGVAFTACLYSHWMRTAGTIEWVVTFLGAFWLLSFTGFLMHSNEEESASDNDSDEEGGDAGVQTVDHERRPLLSDL